MSTTRYATSAGTATILAAIGLLLTACTADETPQTGEDTQEDPGTTEEAPDETPMVSEVCVAFSDNPSVKDIPALLAFEQLRADGIDVELQQFSSGDEAVQSVVAGRCDVGFNGSFGAVLAANEAGADLRVIGAGTNNEFSLVSATSYSSIDELDGVRYGVYSELSYDKAMGEVVAQEHGLTFNFVAAGGADARGPALVAGNLDATGLDAATITALEQQAPDSFTVLESFAEAIPGLLTNVMYASANTISSDAEAISAVMTAVTDSYDENIGDVQALTEAGANLVPGWDATLDDLVVQTYADEGLWPTDQSTALSDNAVATSVEFYLKAGNITTEPEPGSFMDTSFVS